jgi:metacaspase-1
MTISALLIGINAYKDAPLKGCVNDIIIARDILVKKYNVPSNQIRLLIDNRATKKEILIRMDWLKNSKSDIKLFWYSGHGAQFPNQNYTDDGEVDGYDEIICPYDFNWDGNWISDDIFSKYFNEIQGKMIAIFDSCHSGTMNKSSLNQEYFKPKSIPAPIDILARNRDLDLSNVLGLATGLDDLFNFNININVTVNNINNINTKLINTPQENLVMISGCQENQTSADAYIAGRYQGALSYCIQKTLMNNLNITYENLYKSVCQELQNQRFNQIPNFVCSKSNTPFLQ